jgi:hypothetical protein
MLDPRVRTVWGLSAIGTGAFLLVVAVVAAVGLWVWDAPRPLAALPVVLALAWMVLDVLLLPEVRYRRWRWGLARGDRPPARACHDHAGRSMARVQRVDTAAASSNAAMASPA